MTNRQISLLRFPRFSLHPVGAAISNAKDHPRTNPGEAMLAIGALVLVCLVFAILVRTQLERSGSGFNVRGDFWSKIGAWSVGSLSWNPSRSASRVIHVKAVEVHSAELGRVRVALNWFNPRGHGDPFLVGSSSRWGCFWHRAIPEA